MSALLTDPQCAAYLIVRRLIPRGRGAFFETPMAAVPESSDEEIAADNLIPQFGFIGNKYDFGGCVMVAINPATTATRSDEDKAMMQKLDDLLNRPTQKTYKVAMSAQRQSCPHWRASKPWIKAFAEANLKLPQIAYFNTNPYRTGGGAAADLYPNSEVGRNEGCVLQGDVSGLCCERYDRAWWWPMEFLPMGLPARLQRRR